jgi:hypothetical protein
MRKSWPAAITENEKLPSTQQSDFLSAALLEFVVFTYSQGLFYFFAPFKSYAPWCSTKPVTAPLSSLSNSTFASTPEVKNTRDDSASSESLGWPVACTAR